MNTVEAIQADLGGMGIMLIPGTPEDPPNHITRRQIQDLLDDGFRVFPNANHFAPIFKYEYNEEMTWWELVDES